MNIFEYIGVFLSGAWSMFSVEYPGTGISIAGIAVGSLVIMFTLRLFGYLLGLSFPTITMTGEVRGGNNKDITISDDRRGDSF